MGFIPENVIVNLKKEISASGGAAIEALTTRVQTLESTVGDETSGLVKDVSDLKTTVGDSSSGLVKALNDTNSALDYRTSYSLNEFYVGFWLGGKLYRKVIDVGALTQNQTKTVDTGLSNVNVVNICGYAASSSYVFPVSYIDLTDAQNPAYIRALYGGVGNSVFVSTNMSNIVECKVVIEYTKNPAPETREDDQEENVLK